MHNIIWLIHLCFLPNDITTCVIAPLLFLYIKSLFLKGEHLVKNTLVHFIPALLFAVCITIPTILFNTFQVKALAYTHTDFISKLIRIENLYFLLYIFISLQSLSKYKRLTKFKYSNLSKYDFNWIKMMLVGAFCIMLVDLGFKVYKTFYGHFNWNTDYFSVLTMIILVSYLGYYGVNQSKVLIPDFLLKDNNDGYITPKEKSNVLSDANKEAFETLKNRLETILKTDKPYLDEDLTLGKLSEKLSTTDKKLSTMLNQYMNISFYDLINKHRIEAVIEKMPLDAYKNYNIFGIACECGFKSRTSFNRIFKRETGLSPSDYKATIF
ncbi:helix-turn-helix domain-containing protein [Flavivirga eckloniae]|uniref:helix-turn-helix domain-containing protein n=1 Tax=Flavivirga eckloniae TaxID=1803846 RepID=UPI001315807B|nr:helix-turn-helix domain-containing protein [Flavivirga eckloniae]